LLLNFHKTKKDPEIQIILIDGIDGVILCFVEIEKFPHQGGRFGAIIQHDRFPPRKIPIKPGKTFILPGFIIYHPKGGVNGFSVSPGNKAAEAWAPTAYFGICSSEIKRSFLNPDD
jgi:hypothetical protein